MIGVVASTARGPPKACRFQRDASRRETPRVDGNQCRCPPVKQRAPFVHGCVPKNFDPSHDMGRVRLLMQRQAPPTAKSLRQPTGGFFLRRRRRKPSAPFSCLPETRDRRTWHAPCRRAADTECTPSRPTTGGRANRILANRQSGGSQSRLLNDAHARTPNPDAHASLTPVSTMPAASVFQAAMRFPRMTEPVRFASYCGRASIPTPMPSCPPPRKFHARQDMASRSLSQEKPCPLPPHQRH